MAATSLSEQLQKLTVPQATVYKDVSKKVSLLFDPKEAATKDRETFYEIGLSGLQELISLYEGFRLYEDSLFSLTSKDFERAIQTKEVNQNLDVTIEKFLLQLSPYLLLQSSHKALEWLINRYHIQQYNQDAIMALILPYHETKIFVRFVQLLDLKNSKRWGWLKPIQKEGIPLTKQVLYNHCKSNNDVLQFISKNTLKYVKEFGDRGNQLTTVFAFLCSTSIGAMNTVQRVKENVISALLPTLIKGLESQIFDFRSSAYVILGFLSAKATFKEDTLNFVIDKILTADYELSYDMVLLINLFYMNQKHINKLSEVILNDLSMAGIMNKLCAHLKSIAEQKINIEAFVIAFLSSILPLVQSDLEEFRKFSNLIDLFIEEVDLKTQNCEKVIKSIIEAYHLKSSEEIRDGDESDIEFVDGESDFSVKILAWYSTLLKNIEKMYPDAFDKVIKKEMSSESSISSRKRKQLSKALRFKPAVAHKVGGSYLFENLNHVNPELRVEAVKYIAKEYNALKSENVDFVRESLLNRFNDDNKAVVAAALEVPTECLREVLSVTELTSIFVNIMSKGSKKWNSIIKDAVVKFCSIDILPVNHETVLAIMPYLFPYDEKSALLTWDILNSPWGNKFGLTKNLKDLKQSYKDYAEVLSDIIFRTLFEDRKVDFHGVLDILQLNKDNTLHVCMYLLLKSCSYKEDSAEEITDTLDLLIESVENRAILPSAESQGFCKYIMPELITYAREDKLLFEIMEYTFSRMIEDMTIGDIPKPWCNICENNEVILIRRLYEIFVTGCAIPSYCDRYSKLLRKLLYKCFDNSKEMFEFIVNVSCGHILYATDAKNVISPELQLRSLKLLTSYIKIQVDAKWLYESDVIVLMVLFNLNHPLAAVRECVIHFVNALLWEDHDKNLIHPQLMKALLMHKQELLLDHEQIFYILNTIFTQSTPGQKIFKKKCLAKFSEILVADTPTHIKASFIKIFSNFNNADSFSVIAPSLNSVERILKNNVFNSNFTMNIYESNLIRCVYNHINERTVSTFTKKEVWDSVECGLKEYRECVVDEDQTTVSPCVLILKQINEPLFKNVPKEKRQDLIRLITSAGTFSNNPVISSAASKTMKKIHLNFQDFKPILEEMLNAVDPGMVAKKKKSLVSLISYQLTETDEWRLGVTLLEYVQSKKKMTVDNSFVLLLFQLLKKCLRFEDQSYVEYTKQLILSSLWYFCKKFVTESDHEQLKSLKSIFEVDLVVQCIRGTQNPQTHHHALILLSHSAFMMPEQVLHHTMEIFTFMGSSVLRHDDAYSFQIIIKIIETLVPILVKLDRNVEEYTQKELQQLQNRVVPVLRIFADVVLHVPEHRRLPLYKKLIETLGASQFLWIFLGLLLETHIAHIKDPKKDTKKQNRTLADQESPITRLDFGQNLILEFSAEVGLETFIKLVVYIKSLPLQKDKNSMETDVDPSEIFSVNGHTPLQLRHYKYVVITFINTCLATSRFIQHCNLAKDIKIMEGHYKSLIVNILTFIQTISKANDDKNAYWRVMLHHSYDLLDHTNSLLSAPMFLSVVKGLLTHTLATVRRKTMELLNSKIQFSPEMFDKIDKNLLYSLLPVLMDIVGVLDSKDSSLSEQAAQESEINVQTALLSIKLLTRMLAPDNPEPFKLVLEAITEYTCNPTISGDVMASIVLCLAELCGNLKAHALSSLRKFMPALIKVLKKQRKAETPEVVLLSTVTAITKIVESVPLFLSPYLQKILYEYSILLAKWQKYDQESAKVSAIVTKLLNIRKKIATSIPPRVLIPVANETHKLLLEKKVFGAIGPIMLVLAESFSNITTADFNALQQDLTAFFLSALQLRSDAAEKNVDPDVIDAAEDEVVNALVSLVLKLSETSFRPFYFKIYDWAIRTNIEGQKDRAITFYRLSSAIADKLKGLFVLFAGHFIKNAAELLDSCNISKTEDLYFDSEEKCITLLTYIIKTLHIVFLYDSQNFINKDRFETLMQPVVDQLENLLGGISTLKTRASESIIPCISQFAVATADDSLWKLLNYQILLKIRHNDAEIRLIALDCLVSMATQLGSSWLPLLAESVPFLAELLEDGDARIEVATKEAIRKLEQILGEPLEKYF